VPTTAATGPRLIQSQAQTRKWHSGRTTGFIRNLRSKGTLPIAILSAADFDALTVDAATVTLAGAPVKVRPNGTPQAAPENVNGDGLVGLVFHVLTSELQIGEGASQAVLTGKANGGAVIFRGTDRISIRGK
jgi:hypothetical protein